MAELEHAFEVEASGSDTLERCTRALREDGWRVRSADGSVSATRGSQFRMRFFGAWSLNVDPGDLPQELLLSVSEQRLRVTLRDRVGIGYVDHRTKEKYAIAFARAEAFVRAACR